MCNTWNREIGTSQESSPKWTPLASGLCQSDGLCFKGYREDPPCSNLINTTMCNHTVTVIWKYGNETGSVAQLQSFLQTLSHINNDKMNCRHRAEQFAMCVFYKKPLEETTKCNTKSILFGKRCCTCLTLEVCNIHSSKIDTAELEILTFEFHILLLKPCNYITHNTTQLLTAQSEIWVCNASSN